MMRIHLFGQNPYESIYGLESEYISFFAIEYEYNYPVRDMDLSPYQHNYSHRQKNYTACALPAIYLLFTNQEGWQSKCPFTKMSLLIQNTCTL